MTARLRLSTLLVAGWAAAVPTLLAATFTVTNTNDSGAGSLRQAILDANANPGLDTETCRADPLGADFSR